MLTSSPSDKVSLPIKVLCLIVGPPGPSDFDPEHSWKVFDLTLDPFRRHGSIHFKRLHDPTELALRKWLAEDWNVLHLIVHGQERSAGYSTITLRSFDGGPRNLTAQALAALLELCPSLRLVVIQACDKDTPCFDLLADELIHHNRLAVATTPRLHTKSQQLFLAGLYSGLLDGFSAEQLSRDLSSAVPGTRILGREPGQPVFRLAVTPAPSQVRPAPAPPTASSGSLPVIRRPEVIRQPEPLPPPPRPPMPEQQMNRLSGSHEFDVFLCYNHTDRPAVEQVARRLKELRIRPWLDIWELKPGQRWQVLLEEQIERIRSAAVFIGSSGIGQFQKGEMYAFLGAFTSRESAVIPVFLADAPRNIKLPIFLRQMHWVDFRESDPDPWKSLIWGITGKKPGED